jgi:hypothetical protein
MDFFLYTFSEILLEFDVVHYYAVEIWILLFYLM